MTATTKPTNHRSLPLPVVIQAEQGANAHIVNATPECPVLCEQPVVEVTLGPTDVHLLERLPVVRLLEQGEGADLQAERNIHQS